MATSDEFFPLSGIPVSMDFLVSFILEHRHSIHYLDKMFTLCFSLLLILLFLAFVMTVFVTAKQMKMSWSMEKATVSKFSLKSTPETKYKKTKNKAKNMPSTITISNLQNKNIDSLSKTTTLEMLTDSSLSDSSPSSNESSKSSSSFRENLDNQKDQNNETLVQTSSDDDIFSSDDQTDPEEENVLFKKKMKM
mgnify:CR=1 FL=1